MPIPHQEMRRIIKRRIQGTEGTERIRILNELLKEFPGYQTGPYGQLRKWVHQLIDEAKVRRSVKHQDEFHVPKDGCAQVALVGPPNAGKSTLLRKLTGRSVEVGDYRFTTLRPAAGILNVGGARVQLLDLPGLVKGAREGVGGGKALLAAIRAADALVYCLPAESEGFLHQGADLSPAVAMIWNLLDLIRVWPSPGRCARRGTCRNPFGLHRLGLRRPSR